MGNEPPRPIDYEVLPVRAPPSARPYWLLGLLVALGTPICLMFGLMYHNMMSNFPVPSDPPMTQPATTPAIYEWPPNDSRSLRLARPSWVRRRVWRPRSLTSL